MGTYNKIERDKKYKKLKSLRLICPKCDSWNVQARSGGKEIICRRCGKIWRNRKLFWRK